MPGRAIMAMARPYCLHEPGWIRDADAGTGPADMFTGDRVYMNSAGVITGIFHGGDITFGVQKSTDTMGIRECPPCNTAAPAIADF